jgi:HK97 family phage major capsid protein
MSDSLKAEIKEIYRRAEEESRGLTTGEKGRVVDLLSFIEKREEVKSLGKILGAPDSGVPANGSFLDPTSWGGGGPGDRFIASEGYKSIRDSSSRPQDWSSGVVEVSRTSPLEMKGTLLETGAGGPGGGLIPPAYQPGIVSKLFEPLGVSDVFGSSQTTAAAGVAEGGVKPESNLAYSEIVEPIKKIATVLPISDEFLEDAPSIQSYLNERLGLFVRIEEERQLLRGNGTNELIGLFNRSGAQAINTYTKLGTDDNAVALARVLANTRGSANVQPDTIILHPTNWLTTRLMRDGTGGTIGQFYGGGPFTGAYGVSSPGAPNLFGESLWGTRVVLSTVVGSGTALVGNFSQAAHVWRKGGVSIEASNSHDTFFVKDLTMLRAEERLGLGVFRPSAFTAVSGLT